MKNLRIILAVLGLGLAFAAAAQDDDPDTAYKFQEKDEIRNILKFPDPGKPGTLIVDNVFGAIEVQGSDRADVEMVARRTIRAKSADRIGRAKAEVKLDTKAAGNGIDIYVDGPFRCQVQDCEGLRWLEWGYEVQYDFVLKVPRRTGLTLKTVNRGEITVRGVEGDFDVRNVNGRITMESMAGSGPGPHGERRRPRRIRPESGRRLLVQDRQRRRRGVLPGRPRRRPQAPVDARRSLFRLCLDQASRRARHARDGRREDDLQARRGDGRPGRQGRPRDPLRNAQRRYSHQKKRIRKGERHEHQEDHPDRNRGDRSAEALLAAGQAQHARQGHRPPEQPGQAGRHRGPPHVRQPEGHRIRGQGRPRHGHAPREGRRRQGRMAPGVPAPRRSRLATSPATPSAKPNGLSLDRKLPERGARPPRTRSRPRRRRRPRPRA